MGKRSASPRSQVRQLGAMLPSAAAAAAAVARLGKTW